MVTQSFVEEAEMTAERPGGWVLRPNQEVVGPLSGEIPLMIPSIDPPARLSMVFTDDGTYIPAVVSIPTGTGPFPVIFCVHGGTGGLGYAFLVHHLMRHGWLYEELVDHGYAVCITEGRREIEGAYGDADRPYPLDHEDITRVIRHVCDQHDIDSGRAGYIGTSHGGELGIKVISAMRRGLRALVLCEPAVTEFLGLRRAALAVEITPEGEPQLHEHLADEAIDVERALERLAAVASDVAVLVLGRDADHMQGLFSKLHELLLRSNVKTEWESWDHPDHVYQWGPAKTDHGYDPDEIQIATRDRILAFLGSTL
jgi:dienelactone hydrolase